VSSFVASIAPRFLDLTYLVCPACFALPACTSAVTKLEFAEWNTLDSHHILPPNAQKLTVASVLRSDCLLPLTQLRQLTLLGHEHVVTPAAELRQLSSLTSLTCVDLSYVACAEDIAAAADGWGDLQLRRLYIQPYMPGSKRLTRDTLLALSRLTGLWSLKLYGCELDALPPAELGAVLGQLASLDSLTLESTRLLQPQQQQQQQQQVDSSDEDEESSSSSDDDASSAEDDEDDDIAAAAAAAAAESQVAPLLRSMAARIHNMELRVVHISGQRIDRAAAAVLAGFVGLEELHLNGCKLEDCSVIDIALGLQQSLTNLCVARNPGVTDACLPLLRTLRRLTALNLHGTRMTRQGKQRYLPQRLWGRR
jgi:hypothetical protein